MFTDKQIKNLPTRDKPYREWEQGPDRGFGIQVTPAGTKSFFLFYTLNGKRRFMNLGRYPDTALKDARGRCRDARALLEQDIDPQAHREAEKVRQQQQAAEAERRRREAESQGSVKQLFDAYVASMEAGGKRSSKEVERCLYRDALPVIGETTKAADVTPNHIKLVLHKVIARGAEVGANRLRSYLSAAFRYGIEHDFDPRNMDAAVLFNIAANPARDVPKPVKREAVGERDLSADEIRDFWCGLPDSGTRVPTQIALKLILATGGQRVGEVLGATWSEFDLDAKRWEIPGTRTKNGKPHVVPLPDLVIHLLAELAPFAGASPLLFPKSGDDSTENAAMMPYATLTRAVTRFCAKSWLPKFTPRDLRRTCKTRMGEIGITKEVRDKLHNHAATDVSAKHYDRYDYLAEKQRAMEAWGRWLDKTVRGVPESNVIPMVR